MSMPNTAFGGSVESAQRSTLSRSRTGMGGGITGKLPPPVSVPRKNARRCRSRPTFHAGWWIRHAALAASRAPEAKAPSTEVGTAWAPALLVRLDYDHPHRDFTRQRYRLSLLRVQPTQGPWAGV